MKKKDIGNKDTSEEYILTPEEDRTMDMICDATIDLILSNPKKYLVTSNNNTQKNVENR